MLALWQRIAPHITQPDWRRLARSLSSEQLSAKLTGAARLLLHEGRQDEAYWLLVESIEENPKNVESVSLMNSFPKYVQRRRVRRRITYAGVAAGCACLLLFAFVIGRRSRDWNPGGALSAARIPFQNDRSARLSWMPRTRSAGVGTVPFRCDSASAGRLSGTLLVEAGPAFGTLSINGSTLDLSTGYRAGITLAPGKHTLAWVDAAGRVPWRGKITLLPFETKIVSIAVASAQKPRGP